MRIIIFILLMLPGILLAQQKHVVIGEIDNSFFKKDSYWRGADGGATVELGAGKVLWLFSDTFIDQDGTGQRSHSGKLIRNSIAIQDSNTLNARLNYYYKWNKKKPVDYFKVPGKNWFWTGHGIMVRDRLIIFLIEERSVNTGIGFEAVGWYVAIIDNPADDPDKWSINYYKGSQTFGVIVGSSAVLDDEHYVYAFGVKEPVTHNTYLLRFGKEDLLKGNLEGLEWRVNNKWVKNIPGEPESSSLFSGQTEFSVHFDKSLKKYIQVQTYGFGKASIGYRLADQLYGPWSEPVLIYTPPLKNTGEFVYAARAHPEFKSEGLVITYNINNGDFGTLISDEDIYFPKIIEIDWGIR